jgi:hypothetical protein
VGCPLYVVKGILAVDFYVLGRNQELHGKAGKILSQRIVNLTSESISFLQDRRLPGGFCQSGQMNGQAGLDRSKAKRILPRQWRRSVSDSP